MTTSQNSTAEITEHHSRFGLKLTIFTITLVMCLGAFEMICRRLDINFNPIVNRRFHPTLGWTQERSEDYVFDMEGHQVRVQFNSLGFRDVEHAVDKPAGVKRLVVIGDSFSEALQVDLEQTYWHRIQDLLNSTSSSPWEVINLGVGDYGTAQEYLALMEYGLRYSPDLVLLEILPFNDICNNAIELADVCHSPSDRYRPYFVETADGLKLTWANPVGQWLRTSVVSFGVLEKAYVTLSSHLTFKSDERLNRERYMARGLHDDPIFLTFLPEKEQPAAVAQGWRVTESLLKQIDTLCRQHSVPWLAVVMPADVFVAGRWQSFSRLLAHLNVSRDYAERRLSAFAERLGVPLVILLDLFDKHQDEVLPYRGGHLNPAGHDLAAKAVYEKMVAAGNLLPPALPLRLKFGDRISRRWLKSGWYQDESAGAETHVWSNGRESMLEVPLTNERDIRMSFECKPFSFAGSPQQHVFIVLNGHLIKDLPINSQPSKHSVILPKQYLSDGTNSIELRYAYA